MSSDSENDVHEDLLRTTEEVMRAKETNPGMFVSAWQADEEDISYWTKKELKKDPKKLFILSGQRRDIGTMKSILESEIGPNWADEAKRLKDFLLAKDEDGYTALHRAVYSGQVPAAEVFLIRSGADIESKTEDGWRPLHSAAFWNQLAYVRLLLEVGADITAMTSSGQSVLHLALANNQTPETLAYLLAQLSSDREAFSKVWNYSNKSGDTPENLLMRSSSLGSFLKERFSSEALTLFPNTLFPEAQILCNINERKSKIYNFEMFVPRQVSSLTVI
ncbi:unnamed protein product [Rodentolepis nana]|uniref:ANK_REP_REGION domain-containing protein n=1 Tax=Rodentolepis nana TaxID=102285 RepID=A0A0R3T7K2_RODNA|nr:unnamed protein product [Rodentolepis nana]